jgi:alpha(1,3/1,4) fucosyltransferase
MKPRVRIAFCDFWPKFDPADNYFTRLLERRFTIELCERPDFLIYSCFGRRHRQFQCTRVFYAGENWHPDFRVCDWAFTFDHLNDSRHFRLPLYALYGDPHSLVKQPIDAAQVLSEKTRFCNFVYSNPLCRTRNRFFKLLSKYKRVDSGGRLYNNLGGPVADKSGLVRASKFTIAFENDSRPGYTTEKLSQPMEALSVPIYWGNPLVHLDFNPRSFINVHDFPNLDAAARHVAEVDSNDALYLDYLRQPWYHDNRVNQYVDPEQVLARFEEIFATSIQGVAMARSSPRFVFFDQLHAIQRSLHQRVRRSAKKISYRLIGS